MHAAFFTRKKKTVEEGRKGSTLLKEPPKKNGENERTSHADRCCRNKPKQRGHVEARKGIKKKAKNP